jgi:hypothetical protein
MLLNLLQTAQNFVDRIALVVEKYKIIKSLVINFDQTGVHIIPVSNRTFAQKGSRQVALRFKGDKRQITALLAGTAAGDFLPEQLIFQGKTNACHPKVVL